MMGKARRPKATQGAHFSRLIKKVSRKSPDNASYFSLQNYSQMTQMIFRWGFLEECSIKFQQDFVFWLLLLVLLFEICIYIRI